MVILGVDVSYHNGTIAWSAVAQAGYPWATAKVSSGVRDQSPSTVPWAAVNVPPMLHAGLGLVGGYHYLRPGAVVDQVGFYLAQMNLLLGGVAGRICQLDVEDDGNGAPSWADVLAWCQEFARRTEGHPLALYLPDWYWERLGRPNLTVLPNVVLWRSEYVAGSGPPGQQLLNAVQPWMWEGYGGLSTQILQYSSKATVPGVPTRCDVNVYRGTLTGLTTLLTGTGEADMDGTTIIISPPDVSIPGVEDQLAKSFAWWIGAQYQHILGAEAHAKAAAAASAQPIDLDALADKVAERIIAQVGPDVIAQRIAERLGNG